MFLRIILASLKQNKDNRFLAFLTIFLSVMLIACMLNITLKIGNEIAKQLRSYGSNIVVLPRANNLSIEINGREYSPLKNDVFLEEKYLYKIKEIFWRNNITAYAPFLSFKSDGFSLVGTYFNKNINISDEPDFRVGVENLYQFWVVDGRYPKDDSLNEALAGANLGLKIGDEIKLGEYQVKIVGILKESENEANKIIAPLALIQALSNKSGLIDKVEVLAMTIPENDLSIKARRNIDNLDSLEYDLWYCSAYVGSIAHQIEQEYPGASAKAVLSVSQTQSQISKKIQNLMAVISVLALIISSICITSLLSAQINKRKKQIGLLKALGASASSIYLLFVSEIFIVCIFASLLGALGGYILSFLIAYKIFGAFIGISFMVLPLSVIFGLIICIFGSALPLKSVIKLLPAEVLYGRK
ncbi:ferrirhodotorulic acid ABC transporter, permease protein [Candidatus Campylobacter infans]|uniref:Ferrirhodotorulic acid ABC transporter, permease protein n=1 Tax=Candidatus Campylobacter infans TaxID=2561898 RepID=A0A7H9CKU1_9BACT|nr:ABC transporter permease [Candidatus Campylobacter infans]QLI05429.1 ferrirhodotorulic acid ABC transporter, permease protein [Candidatus Campylobacter infans]